VRRRVLRDTFRVNPVSVCFTQSPQFPSRPQSCCQSPRSLWPFSVDPSQSLVQFGLQGLGPDLALPDPATVLSFKIVTRTLRPKSAKEMDSWAAGPILKIFAVPTLHVGFSLDHPGAFLLFSVPYREIHRRNVDLKWFVHSNTNSTATEIPPCLSFEPFTCATQL
jgi:hypothetical protein